MKLTTELVSDLIQALDTNDSEHDERRASKRFETEARVLMAPVSIETKMQMQPVPVRDMSTTGISILSPRIMQCGEQFIIQFEDREKNTIKILCSVKNCRLHQDGLFRIGAEFVRCIQKPRPVTFLGRVRKIFAAD